MATARRKPNQANSKESTAKPDAYEAVQDDLICDKCGTHNKPGADRCTQCDSTRFAPEWVKELRRVNRSVAVQITTAHPSSESTSPKITLYKWWPGGKATFNIPTPQQWDRDYLDPIAVFDAAGWPDSVD